MAKAKVRLNARLIGWTALAALLGPAKAQENEYNLRAALCDDGTTIGYDTLQELNLDKADERRRILQEGNAFPNYIFTLCPNTVFDGNNTIVTDLENMQVGCGVPPRRDNNCIITGGGLHMAVVDFAETNHPVTSVQAIGITFSGFEDAAIGGPAGGDTVVELFDNAFSVSGNSFSKLLVCDETGKLTLFCLVDRISTIWRLECDSRVLLAPLPLRFRPDRT